MMSVFKASIAAVRKQVEEGSLSLEQAAMAFLRTHGIDGIRIDLGESEAGDIFNGPRPGQAIPPHEIDQCRQRGSPALLADPRNRSTPDGAVEFLRKLRGGELLSPAPAQHLRPLMAGQALPHRLRAGVPCALPARAATRVRGKGVRRHSTTSAP
ncbi:serine hydrolase [Dyella sp. EPa41]|uniref:serine hydrolase n=1 Tax=Dyella sp. EPa41 TaxID=1561194 RepID=UPI0019152BF6|nr:serine hydrolase [Dyella sp. EPa41]